MKITLFTQITLYTIYKNIIKEMCNTMEKLQIKEIEVLKQYKDVLTFKELKELLGFGKNKVYKLLQNGEIPSTKIGRDYRILKINVINYLQNQ